MLKRFFLAILFVCIPFLFVSADDALDRALRSTISIFPAGVDDQAGGGSGVIISPDGYALTNFHVVQPCGPAMKCGMADGKLYDAVIVGLDPVGDIALIKLRVESGEWRVNGPTTEEDTTLNNSQFPYSPLADSDRVRIGDSAIVMGNPFLLALDFKPCVSRGIVSGIHRYQFPSGTFLEYTDCLQTDAAVNPGNSGGPMFNENGEVIGIIGRCSFEKRGRVNVGIGYAVSSNQCRYFLGDLKSGRIVDHATMNAVVSTDRDGRVLFDDVLGTSDAYRSGLRYNDELLRFAGRTIDTANAFKNLIGIFPKGWRLPVTVRGKDGERFELAVRLGALHSEAELIEMTEKMMEPPIAPAPREPGAQPPAREGATRLAADPRSALMSDDAEPGAQPPAREEEIHRKEHFIPEAVKPFYEKQRGYANFYFNRIETQRVLEKWRSGFDTTERSQWKFSGDLQGRTETFSFEIDDRGVAFDLPIEKGFWDAELMKREEIFVPDPLMHYQAPRGSGGLFTALFLLRELAVRKSFETAEVVYVGTAPLDGNLQKMYDIIAVSWYGNDVRFCFDPETGHIALIEMFGSSLDFPCEIRFRNIENRRQFEVRYGRILFGVFDVVQASPELPFNVDSVASANIISPIISPGNESRTATPMIENALQKVVKIYGAKGAGLHGYQAGILVSSEGHVLTAITSALQADPLTVVLDSGRKFEARLVDADPEMELAMLKISADELPFFDVDDVSNSFKMSYGDFVLAVSNPFNIAEGNEPVTVQRGAIAARTTLRARRGVFETPYKGPIVVVDFTTNNPGACGGALVCEKTGNLIGILGKELRNNENHSWLNYAIPVFAFRDKVRQMMTRTDEKPQLVSPTAITPQQERIPEDTIRVFQDWGVLLVPTVGRRTPPFIDSVRPDSEAERLGVLPDDLIVMVNDRLTPSLAAVEEQIFQTAPGEKVTLTLERRMMLVEVTFER